VPRSKTWEDIPDNPDYGEVVTWPDTEPARKAKGAPATRFVEVTNETADFLKEKCSQRLHNDDRLSTINAYAFPKVPETKAPVLDAFMKPEVSQNAKTADKELGTIQSAVLDAMVPLTSIVEADAKGDNVTHKQAVNVAKAAIELVGNARTRINHYRRTKIISQMNKALLPLTEEDKNFADAAPALFGSAFAQRSKELVDQVKAMRSHLPSHKDGKQFFRSGPPNSRGDTSTARNQGGEETTVEDSNVPHKDRDPSGTNERIYSKFFDYRFQKYIGESSSMSGDNSPQTNKLPPSRETSALPTKLVEGDSGPMGPKHDSGLPDRFLLNATSTCYTSCPQHSAEQTRLMSEEVTELLQKGAIEKIVPVEKAGFYSNIFLVPKKDGGQRPVINLKALNNFVNKEHFKMEGIHTLKDLLRKGDRLAKIDLKDAFFSIPIHLNHKKFLRFMCKGKTYQFNCLPFGLSPAPWVFTKTLRPALAILRERGIRIIAYIDDLLLLAESKDLILDQVTGMRYLLECLGFIVNTKKSILNPAQVMEFLGLSVDSLAMKIRLPPIKIKQIRAEACKLVKRDAVPARMLVQLLGKMNATNCVLPPGPLFYRHLQMALTSTLEQSSQCYEAQVRLTQECIEELEWWDNNMCRWNGKTVIQRDIDLVIDSNTSLQGWGACCSKQRTGGPWSQQECSMHINCLELLAATLAVKTFAKAKTAISILLRIDNTTAVAYINNLGGTASRELVILTRDLWMWSLERNIHITAVHLPGVLNTIADTDSRQMLDRTDWNLNPMIFQSINHLYGPLDVDLFASRLSTQCPLYFSWRPDPFALATDAFLQDWTARKCYANPPWNLVGRVLALVQSQQVQVVLVAPVWKAQPWFPTLLNMLIDHPRLIIPSLRKPMSLDSMPLLPQLAICRVRKPKNRYL